MIFRKLISQKWRLILLILLNISDVLPKENCKPCGNENCGQYRTECFCEQISIFEKIQEWNQWSGRYELSGRRKLYSYLNCNNLNENSKLGADLCPENDCKYITFYNSNIKVIGFNSFINLSNIRHIFLNNSGIENIQTGAFSGISNIETLKLFHNKITVISKGYLNSLISLNTLDLHNNLISSIEDDSFLGLTALKELDLSYNNISYLLVNTFNPLESLDKLYLSHNNIRTFDINLKLDSLKMLDLSYNQIEQINECINCYFPASSQILYLQNNNISHLDHRKFEGLNELSELIVSKNLIADIPIDLFKDCTNLEYLDLSENKIDHFITGVFSSLGKLKLLNISHLEIQNLDGHTLFPLVDLEILDINHNNLHTVDLDVFNHLISLDRIYLTGNEFSCTVVSSVMSQSKHKNFSVLYEKNFSVENINGLPCKKMVYSQSRLVFTTDRSAALASERNLKIFEDIRDILLIMKTSVGVMIEEFVKEINSTDIMRYQEFSDNQDAGFTKILTALDSIQKKLDNRMSLDKIELENEKLLKTEKPITYCSKENISLLRDELNNLDNSLHQMKVLNIITCITILLLFFVRKVWKWWKYIQENRSNLHISHELPIIVNYDK